MTNNTFESEEEMSKMFVGRKNQLSADNELALHIMHRFNIDRDTMETMPAFDTHIEPLFSKEKVK